MILVVFLYTQENYKICWIRFARSRLSIEVYEQSKQGRPPRNSEKGAVRYGWANVASETTLTLGQKLPQILLLFCYFFRPLYVRNELPQFLLLF